MWTRAPKIIAWMVGGIALGVVFAFLFGWIVMLLWNWIMPPVFGLTMITFWQAWGLLILTHILFKGGHGYHGHHLGHGHPGEWRNNFKSKVKAHFEGCGHHNCCEEDTAMQKEESSESQS